MGGGGQEWKLREPGKGWLGNSDQRVEPRVERVGKGLRGCCGAAAGLLGSCKGAAGWLLGGRGGARGKEGGVGEHGSEGDGGARWRDPYTAGETAKGH